MTNISKRKLPVRDFLLNKVGRQAIIWLENIIERYSLVENSYFVDPNYFCWTAELENNWQTIRQELDVILKATEKLPNFQDISQDQSRISQDDRWKTYFLYGYGIKLEQNCHYCPETTKLIESVPGMKTAFFSILLPGKHIPEHRGAYKGVLRYHLGLKVPQESDCEASRRHRCHIRVGDEFRTWSEGKSLLFDDSYLHEAWNLTNEIRVVLFMDIVRPCKFPVSLLNSFLIYLIRWSPFIQDARKNQAKWNERMAKIFEN